MNHTLDCLDARGEYLVAKDDGASTKELKCFVDYSQFQSAKCPACLEKKARALA